MRLCVSAALVLLLGLTRARADPVPGPEGCDKLEKLRVITDKSEMVGQFYSKAAYTDNPLFKSLLGLTSNLWGDMTETPTGLHVRDYTKLNGTCVQFRGNMILDGDTVTSTMAHVTNEFKLLHFTSTAMIMDLTATTTNALGLIHILHLDPNLTGGQNTVTAHCYYLISREPQENDAELQMFKERAKCAGFTEEPAFLYKNENGYCTKKDSIFIEGSEECNNLNPLDTINDVNQLLGPFHFMAGFADDNPFKDILGSDILSQWGEIIMDDTGLHTQEYKKMNDTCLNFRANLNVDGDKYRVFVAGMDGEYKMKHFTKNSKIMEVTVSISNPMALVKTLHLNPTLTQSHSSSTTQGYYLLSSDPELNEAELEMFRQRAKCAGFSGGTDFVQSKEHGFCTKNESVFVDIGSVQCTKLQKLNTITDKNQFLGKFHFMAAITTNDISNNILGLSSSIWGEMAMSDTGLSITEYNKMNGTCLEFQSNVAFDGEKGKVTMAVVTSEFRLLNFSKDSLIMDLTATTSNAAVLMQALHLDPHLTQGQNSITAHCYYFISRNPDVNEAELELFKEHAKCAGFTGEPGFLHKNSQDYCTKEGSQHVH